MTVALKLVVEWRRLPRFPAKKVVGSRGSITLYLENFVLVLESKVL